MITNLVETSFRDINGTYKKLGLQTLSILDESMIFVNLDGYDYSDGGWDIVDFSKSGNIKFFIEHLKVMFNIHIFAENYRFLVKFRNSYYEIKRIDDDNFDIKNNNMLYQEHSRFL